MPAITKGLAALAVVAVAGAATLFGYSSMRAQVAQDVYRTRLEGLSRDYQSLRERYNEAVRRTAVTELVVEDGALAVRVRNAEGTLAEIPTTYDPSKEVFIDYAVVDGRLWIRRVYDEDTPPSKALLIDPSLAKIDWDDTGAEYGQTVYRSLGEGRWVITVSGDGSLRLARANGPVELAPPPQIKTFEELEEEVRRELDTIGPSEVLKRFLDGR